MGLRPAEWRPADAACVVCLLAIGGGANVVAQSCADYRHNLRVCGTTELGFNASVIALNGGIAYVAGQNRLAAWDVSDPDAPRFLDDVALSVPAQDIVASGSVVCIRDDTRVAVCDAEDPSHLGNPVVLGTFADLRDISVGGDLLLIAGEYTGLKIYDVADPATAHLVGQYPTSDAAMSVAIRGTTALLAECSALKVIDISDPAEPSLLSSFAEPVTPEGLDPCFFDVIATETGAAVQVVQYIGIAYPEYVVISLDLADPAAPELAAHRRGWVEFDDAFDDLLLLRGLGGLEMWVCSPDLGIGRHAVVPWPGSQGMMAGDDDIECGVNGMGQMLVIDARYPGLARPLAWLDAWGMLPGWAVSSTLVGNGGLGDLVNRLYDMSDPFHPLLLDEVHCPGAIYAGGASLLGAWDRRVAWEIWDGTHTWSRVCDFSVKPPVFGEFAEMTVIDLAGERVFVSQHGGPLRIYDIADLGTPVYLGTIAGVTKALALTPEILLAPDSPSTIKVLDCADPASPQVLDTLAVGGSPRWWRREGDRVFIGTDGPTLAVLDVEDPRAPSVVYLESMAGQPSDVAMHGDRAVVALGLTGAQVYDLDGASGIEPCGSLIPIPQVRTGRAVVWVDDVIYVAGGDAGLLAFDVRDPASPVFLGAGNVADAVVAGPGVVVVPYAVMPLHCADVVPVAPDPYVPGPTTLDLTASPNPFNPATTLRFHLARDARVELALFDLAGRHVRQLRQGMLRSGDHALTWDGRDDDGQPQAAGVYLARLRADGAQARTRLMLVK